MIGCMQRIIHFPQKNLSADNFGLRYFWKIFKYIRNIFEKNIMHNFWQLIWNFVIVKYLVVGLFCKHSIVLGTKYCEDKYPVPEISSDFKHFTYDCEKTETFLDADRNNKTIWIDFINCHFIPVNLLTNSSNSFESLVFSAPASHNPNMDTFTNGTIANLGGVIELRLLGFEELKYINEHALSSLDNIQCLYLIGFGKLYLSYTETFSVLRHISASILRSVVASDIQSVRNPNGKLNFSVLAIPNIFLTRLVIENSAASSLFGQLSKIQPSLLNLSFCLTGNYPDVLEILLDILFFMPNIQNLNINGYPDMPVLVFSPEAIIKIGINNIKNYIQHYQDPSCFSGIKIKLPTNLKFLSVHQIEAFNYDDWNIPQNDLPLCVLEKNELLNLDLSNNGLGNTRIITGLQHLTHLNYSNARIRKYTPEQLKEYPQLLTLILSDNDLGEYISTSIGADTFRHSQKLVTLDLARCNITDIPHWTFSSLSSLEYLNLTGNKIKNVDLFLSNCSQLKVLNLSKNAIEKLSSNFTDKQLVPLLTNNNLTHLKSAYLEIDLGENPLSCLCNAFSFVQWIKSTKQIVFTGLSKYMCQYPNGTWLNLMSIDMRQLERQCHVINDLKNNTNCPCDAKNLEQLYAVRYSLKGLYCYYPDEKITEMKLLTPETALKLCSTVIPVFVLPVVISVSIALIFTITIIFVIICKRRKPDNFRERLECFDPLRLTGVLMAILSADVEPVAQEMEANISYDGYFSCTPGEGYKQDQLIISKLNASGLSIITYEDIELGSSRLDALLEITRRCKSIVLVLTPEYVINDWCSVVTRYATVERCQLIPLVYKPIELSESELLFTSILRNYNPIYWPEQEKEQEAILDELRKRILDNTRAQINVLSR